MRTWWLTVAVGMACLVAPAAPRVDAQGRPAQLSGQLLVATDQLRDPRFFHAVIYLLRHDTTGALGLVVNRPLGEMPLADLLRSVGVEGSSAAGQVRVHSGGPVEPTHGFVLHTADYLGASGQVVKDGVAFSVQPDILAAIADGRGPRRWLFVLGYAGWAPGQLEAEIQRGDWITVQADQTLLFDDEAESKWARATARRRIEL